MATISLISNPVLFIRQCKTQPLDSYFCYELNHWPFGLSIAASKDNSANVVLSESKIDPSDSSDPSDSEGEAMQVYSTMG